APPTVPVLSLGLRGAQPVGRCAGRDHVVARTVAITDGAGVLADPGGGAGELARVPFLDAPPCESVSGVGGAVASIGGRLRMPPRLGHPESTSAAHRMNGGPRGSSKCPACPPPGLRDALE